MDSYDPVVSVDFSELGVLNQPMALTQRTGPGYYNYNGQSVWPSFCFNLAAGAYTVGAGLVDGSKNFTVTASDALGSTTSMTSQVLIDNTPPTLSITKIEFSTTSPQNGDIMYLSGTADGTGSELTIYQISESLWNADGSPTWGSDTSQISYKASTLTDAIASSTDDTFTRVPFTLIDGKVPGLNEATSIRLGIMAYDGSGHIIHTSHSEPIPHTPPAPPQSGASNVLFLPGIEASRLYRPDYNGDTDKLWEPSNDGDAADLYQNPDGTSKRSDIYAKAGDVLDEVVVSGLGVNIYKSFINKMNTLKSDGTINDWEPISYDWRLSLDELLQKGHNIDGRIYYSGELAATSTPYIIQELRRLAATSKSGKVTIVAHSNGGLVAKKLTELLGAEAATLIDKIIFVAVPQAGTPMAIASAMHGYGQGINAGPYTVVSKSTARTLANNSPMVYNLMPSAEYFTQVDDPVITFDPSLPDWVARYGATIHSQEGLHTFLTDSQMRVDPETGDINQSVQANAALLTNAETLHAGLDNWGPPVGVSLIQIAGWGVPSTMSGMAHGKTHSDLISTIDGDGTVVVPSALWTSTATGVKNYWVDLDYYNKRHYISTVGGYYPYTHKDIFETSPVLDFVSDQIASTTRPIADYTYLSTQAPAATDARLRYALHSPLSLNLYDDEGRHTGVSTTTGQIEEQIPGTYYSELGDNKYIFSGASAPAHIVMDGYATGTFTFNVDEYSGDVLVASTTFADIPTTAETRVDLDVASDITTVSPMNIDTDGNGSVEYRLAPKLHGIVTLDTTPPELRITFDSVAQAVAFAGIDDAGAVAVTTSTRYPVSRSLIGSIATTTVTARDASGNVTSLVYTEPYPALERVKTMSLRTVSYNGATTTLASSGVSYKWSVDRSGVYTVFGSALTAGSQGLSSSYDARSKTTLIMPQRQTLAGMVVPYMTTQKGKVIINY